MAKRKSVADTENKMLGMMTGVSRKYKTFPTDQPDEQR